MKGRDFDPERVRAVLARTRPADAGEDWSEVAAYACVYRIDGVVMTSMLSSGHPDTPEAPGSIVMVEPRGERECQEIAADGSLVPMRPYSENDDG